MEIEIGKTLKVDVDFTRFGFAAELTPVQARVLRIGARNILMDSHASVKREAHDSDEAYRAASLAVAMKTLDAMYRGEVRQSSSVTRAPKLSPIESEARAMAREFYLGANGLVKGFEKDDSKAAIVAKLRNALGLGDDIDGKGVIARAIEARAKKPEILEAAAKVVAEKAAAAAKLAESVADVDIGL